MGLADGGTEGRTAGQTGAPIKETGGRHIRRTNDGRTTDGRMIKTDGRTGTDDTDAIGYTVYIHYIHQIDQFDPELSTGRMDPRVGSGRVGSGRVGSRFCRILAGRVGLGQLFGFFSFLLIIYWYLNP